MGPFVLKFYSPIPNNFGEGLNFVTCEHSLRVIKGSVVLPVKTVKMHGI